MSQKIAIVINSGLDQRSKVMSGLHVAKRIHDARKENGIETVEIFLFTGGVRMLEKNQDNQEIIEAMSEAIKAGIVTGACSNQVKNWNMQEQIDSLNVKLEFARDAFSRYARDNFTVISF